MARRATLPVAALWAQSSAALTAGGALATQRYPPGARGAGRGRGGRGRGGRRVLGPSAFISRRGRWPPEYAPATALLRAAARPHRDRPSPRVPAGKESMLRPRLTRLPRARSVSPAVTVPAAVGTRGRSGSPGTRDLPLRTPRASLGAWQDDGRGARGAAT